MAEKVKDLFLFHSNDGSEWSQYLEDLFYQEDKKICVRCENISTVLSSENNEDTNLMLKEYLVVAIIFSPEMTEIFYEKANILRPQLEDIALVAVLCGVDSESLSIALGSDFQSLDRDRQLQVGNEVVNRETVAHISMTIKAKRNKALRPRSDAACSQLPLPKKSKRNVKVIPDTVYGPEQKIVLLFKELAEGAVEVKFPEYEARVPAKKCDTKTYIVKVPGEVKLGRHLIEVMVAGRKYHSCPLTLESPSMAEFRSISLIAQALGIDVDDTTEIDKQLAKLFEESQPDDPGLKNLFKAMKDEKLSRSDREIPTTLHFAAANGLSEFCAVLMDSPSALVAFRQENRHGEDPADLAERAGHSELALYLRNFVETCTVMDLYGNYINMYNIYKSPTETELHGDEKLTKIYELESENTATSLDEEEYLLFDETKYPIVPETVKKPALPPRPQYTSSVSLTSQPTRQNSENSTASENWLSDFVGVEIEQPAFSAGSLGSSSLEELIQIQEMVKQGKFSVNDAVRLFEAWKEKFGKMSQSFKERKEKLDELRKEFKTTIVDVTYEEIPFSQPSMKRMESKKQFRDSCYMTFQETTQTLTAGQVWNARLSTASNSSSSSGTSRDSCLSTDSFGLEESSFHITKILGRKEMMDELSIPCIPKMASKSEGPPLPPRAHSMASDRKAHSFLKNTVHSKNPE